MMIVCEKSRVYRCRERRGRCLKGEKKARTYKEEFVRAMTGNPIQRNKRTEIIEMRDLQLWQVLYMATSKADNMIWERGRSSSTIYDVTKMMRFESHFFSFHVAHVSYFLHSPLKLAVLPLANPFTTMTPFPTPWTSKKNIICNSKCLGKRWIIEIESCTSINKSFFDLSTLQVSNYKLKFLHQRKDSLKGIGTTRKIDNWTSSWCKKEISNMPDDMDFQPINC